MIKINNIELYLEEDKADLAKKTAKILGISEEEIQEVRIVKESVDARKEPLKFVYGILVRLKNEEKVIEKVRNKDVSYYEEKEPEKVIPGSQRLSTRPVVVGFGPCGLFTALKLAEEGYRPLVLERGQEISERDRAVDLFMEKGILDSSSNIQFGEGGAGAIQMVSSPQESKT